MEISKPKNVFVIKVAFTWEWNVIFNDILQYKSFSLSPFSITNQMSCWSLRHILYYRSKYETNSRWSYFRRLSCLSWLQIVFLHSPIFDNFFGDYNFQDVDMSSCFDYNSWNDQACFYKPTRLKLSLITTLREIVLLFLVVITPQIHIPFVF